MGKKTKKKGKKKNKPIFPVQHQPIFSAPGDSLANTLFAFEGEGTYGSQTLEPFTVSELRGMSVEQMTDYMVEQDPTIDRVLDDFITFCLPGWTIEAENDATQRAIDSFIEVLEMINNPLQRIFTQSFSSLFLTGEICNETVFANDMPQNILVVNPYRVEVREASDRVLGRRVQIGKVVDAVFEEIQTPNVIWSSLNPTHSRIRGRSMVMSGFSSLISQWSMFQDLRGVIANHAQPLQYYHILYEPLKNAGYTKDEIQSKIIEGRQEADKLMNLSAGQRFVTSEIIEPKRLSSEGERMEYVTSVNDSIDIRVARAMKSPLVSLGIQRYVAESSAGQQIRQYLSKIASTQDTGEGIFSKQFTRVARSMGATGEVKVMFERENTDQQLQKAGLYAQIALALKSLTDANFSLDQSLDLLESLTAIPVPDSVREGNENEPNPE